MDLGLPMSRRLEDKGDVSLDERHAQACAEGLESYRDPATGYRVFTALSLQKRGSCCGCGCRHCPYGHVEVDEARRAELKQDPWLELNGPMTGPCDLLSWSGGKDSFLALVALAKAGLRDVVLLTTFDGRSGQVAHQEVHIDEIRAQAKALSVNLLLTPLYPETDYLTRVTTAITLLATKRPVCRVAFGDLHLEHVRDWRRDHLGPPLKALNLELHFPLWEVPYAELEERFFASGATATLSALSDDALAERCAVGDAFTQAWLNALPKEVDRFGENGEFHTLVDPPKRPWQELGAL